ncbi:MAG: hypothetical protein HY675_07540 [Chloroflexi bacterium]|nr:hypothetical protein [Chloroflexota bacterium]
MKQPDTHSTNGKLKLVVLSHTHWDREWYLPFQEFRLKLVRLIDELLDILRQDPDYRYFMLDGQTIVLEDYLEVRPERRAELLAHIASERVLIGPWYVLPDEFLVSGESLIRNLLTGLRLASEYGKPMKVGYLPDQFGHIAQMPQILGGFGIDSAVIWRGVGDSVRHTELLWQAPDGSSVLALYLPSGYFNAPDLPLNEEELLARIDSQRRLLEPRATTPYLALMNGADHAFPQAALSKILATANTSLDDAQLMHANLPWLIDRIKREIDHDRQYGTVLETLSGELRSCATAHLLPGVASTRMWIKQQNAACETLLEKWAEPFSAFASLEAEQLHPGVCSTAVCRRPDAATQPRNAERWRAALRLAWKYLLQNQAHDSICGCSVDQVHEEMRTRFDWCRQIGEAVTREALLELTAHIDTRMDLGRLDVDPAVEPTPVVVFNPTEGPRSDYVTVALPVARCGALIHRCGALIHQSPSPTLLDSQGTPQAYELLQGSDAEPDSAALCVGFVARNVPAHGYKTFWLTGDRATPNLVLGAKSRSVEASASVRPGGGPEHRRPFASETDVATVQVGTRSDLGIENDFLRVLVDARTGTLSILDKEASREYRGLNLFVDEGDAGDEYNFSPVPNGRIVSGLAREPRVTTLNFGPCRHTLRVEGVIDLPTGITEDRRTRSADTVGSKVVTDLSIYAGLKRVDVHVELDNQAQDHRLRVLFPTGIAADASQAESHYAVLRRPVGVPAHDPSYVEHPVGSFPQKTFVDVGDGSRGLMVANRGLPDCEVLGGADGATIALTLLRCVGWLSRSDLISRRGDAGPAIRTPAAQCLGKHSFDFSLIPHLGPWEEAQSAAHRFVQPLRAIAADIHTGHLPDSLSFLNVDPKRLVVSAVKTHEEGRGLVVRLYNADVQPTSGRIELFRPFAKASLVTLEEKQIEEVGEASGVFHLEAGAAQILTFHVEFDPPVGG